MGVLGKILGALRRVLKRTVVMIMAPLAFAGDVVGALLRRHQVVDEVVQEVGDAAADIAAGQASESPAEAAARRERLARLREPSIGKIAKEAARRLAAGQKIDGYVPIMPDRPKLLAYLTTLSSTQVMTMTHCTVDALDRHFDPSTAYRVSGLPSYATFTATDAAERREAIRTRGWTEHDFFEDMRAKIHKRGDADAVDWEAVYEEACRLAALNGGFEPDAA